MTKERTKKNRKSTPIAMTVIVLIVLTIICTGVLYMWTSGLVDTGRDASFDWHNDYMNEGTSETGNPKPADIISYKNMYNENEGKNTFISTKDKPISTFAMDVDTASYTISRTYIDNEQLPPKDAVRIEEFINYFDYNYSSDGNTFTIHTECAPSYFGIENNYMLKIGIQAKNIEPENRKEAVIVFVIDVSGSMDMESRLELVKKSIGILIENLGEGDKIGLVTYGSSGEKILEPTNDRALIENTINNLSPGGSTNAYEGLSLGYEMATGNFEENKINRVILCSDGVANSGITDPEKILREVKEHSINGITLTTLGYGMGNYNDEFMETLGDNGDGNYAYIDSYQEASRLFNEGLAGLLEVVALEAKVQVEFDKTTVNEYRLLGYENRLLDEDEFKDDSVDAGEVGIGHSVTALYELRLNDPMGKVADIWIRYTDPWTKNVAEIKIDMSSFQVLDSFEDATPRFRFTSAVAQFAELLRGNLGGNEIDLKNVLRVSQNALKELQYSEEDSEKDYDFIEMVEKTDAFIS